MMTLLSLGDKQLMHLSCVLLNETALLSAPRGISVTPLRIAYIKVKT